MSETSPSVENWLSSQTFGEASRHGRLSPGDVVDEWRVTAYLGRGLSAEVYRVANVRFGHEGALKLLVDPSRGLATRFDTERDALRILSLKVLPRFMGSGVFQGAPYYVMEYLLPLPDPFPRREVPRFMNRLAKAVQLLHDAGYIHRDLKPGNILRRANGEPVLIDLGTIKRRGTGVSDPIVRFGRSVSIIDGKPVGVGTLDFAAPEQLLKGEAFVQSDVFSLGKILRSLYAGYEPSSLRPVVRKATNESPFDRYESADAFAAAVRHRNYARIIAGACAAFALAVLAVSFAERRAIYGSLRPLVRPQVVVMSIAKSKNESDEAYFNRLSSAARDGNAVAQCALAEAYFHGQGTLTNLAEAVRWYRLSADAGNADAQASLAYCLLRGRGCTRDVAEAIRWYERAADQKNLTAMNDLAFCRMNGIGVPRDPQGAFKLALEAAKSGHAPAQAFVGECYLCGDGVEADVNAAETWLYRAARLGNKRAKMLVESR